ncbi:MAG TPA: hypothetical protein PK156_21990 [Polyangium sp.]|nr:hypothetical protein [Polyangium sp.]
MNIKLLLCTTIFAAGCSAGGKPTEVGGDASSPPSPSNTAAPTTTTATTTTPPDRTDPPPSGNCGGKTCASGETCVSYYGIAGPRGPQFHDCVIPCKRGTTNDGCPAGKKCATIADGPGDVCQ